MKCSVIGANKFGNSSNGNVPQELTSNVWWMYSVHVGQWVGLKKLLVVVNINKLTYSLSFFILGISNSYCMWELLNLCWNV